VITKTARDIDALRSERGQEKGARTNDTLHRIGKLLDKHGRLDDPEQVLASLGLIVGLCRHWLDKHKKTSKKAVTHLVEDILAQAHRDHGVARAQRRYLNDARAGAIQVPQGVRPTRHALKVGMNDAPVTGAAMTAGLQAETSVPEFGLPGDEKIENHQLKHKAAYLVRTAGLTEAEVLALKKFSTDDYMYINPAMESQVHTRPTAKDEHGKVVPVQGPMPQPWLDKQMPQVQATLALAGRRAGREDLVEEGTLHAGVAMQGLAKMPAKQGTVFRGERMSPAFFAKMFESGPTTTVHSFRSLSTRRSLAEGFSLNGVVGNPVRPDQTLSVMSVYEVHDARDIKPLSLHDKEDEWMVLPGSTFDVTITDEAVPPTTSAVPIEARKVVYLKQRKKGPARPRTPAPRGRPRAV
jgi:hypothetical protein